MANCCGEVFQPDTSPWIHGHLSLVILPKFVEECFNEVIIGFIYARFTGRQSSQALHCYFLFIISKRTVKNISLDELKKHRRGFTGGGGAHPSTLREQPN